MVSGKIGNSGNCLIDEKGPFPARILLSKSDTGSLSVKHGVLAVGRDIKIHSHDESDQMEFYIAGKAILFVEGIGEKEIRQGTFMYAPKGVKHGIRSVQEPVEMVSVFVPPLF